MQSTQRKREKIINAAIALFIRNGVKKTTMQELAALANVSKVTIYKYFGDKDTLYAAVCGEICGQYDRALQTKIDASSGIMEKMTGCTTILTEFICSGNMTLCNALAGLNPAARAAYEGFQDTVKSRIMSLIQQGREVAIIRRDVDLEILYHYINMGLSYFQHHKAYREKMMHDPLFQKAFLPFMWEHIFIGGADGLRSAAARGEKSCDVDRE